jgi:hypothetical protein
MEILKGFSLDQSIEDKGPLAIESALEIFCAVSLGLEHAHKNGIVHRDLKPGNIFLSTDASGLPNIPKLLDFGIAKLAVAASDKATQSLTNTGQIFGSPLYMSPEQIMADDIDLRSDIYSLGCTIYHAVSGAPPFVTDNALATMQMHLAAAPPSLPAEIKALPAGRELNLVIQRMLAKDPDKRYQSAAEVWDALERLRNIAKKGPDNLAPSAVTNNFGNNSPALKMGITVAAVAAVATLSLACVWNFYTPTASQVKIEKNKVVGLKTDIPGYKKLPGIEKELGSDDLAEVSSTKDGSFTEHFADGRRKLHVPVSVGELRAKILDEKLKDISGNDTILQPKTTLELRASSLAYVRSKLLRGFKPDDLLILHLNRGDGFQSTQFENVAYLSGLKQLSIDGASIDKVSVSYLNRLKNLRFLTLHACTGTAADFASITLFPQLSQITINNPNFKNPLFEKVGHSPELIDLSMKGCDLTDPDLTRIANMPQLRALNLDDNRRITDSGIKTLSRLKNLEVVSLSNLKVLPQSLEKLSVARELRLSYDLYTRAERDGLNSHFGPKIIWQGFAQKQEF